MPEPGCREGRVTGAGGGGDADLMADHLPVFADLIVPAAAVAQNLRINDVARAEGHSGTKKALFKVSVDGCHGVFLHQGGCLDNTMIPWSPPSLTPWHAPGVNFPRRPHPATLTH